MRVRTVRIAASLARTGSACLVAGLLFSPSNLYGYVSFEGIGPIDGEGRAYPAVGPRLAGQIHECQSMFA